MVEFVRDYLKHPEWRRQHRWRHAIWHVMSRVGLTGVHALPLSRRWVEIARVRMPGAQRPLAVVGLDDEWSGHIDPDKGFKAVDPALPIVCLNHNPANVLELMKYPWQWMLAGHTHGRQVATSKFGRTFYPHRFRQYTHGYYNVNGRHLY